MTTGFQPSSFQLDAFQVDGGATSSTAYNLVAQHGTYSLTGQSATLTKTRLITALNGVYDITGQAANLNRNRTLTASFGTYSVAGQDAVITKFTPGAYVLTALHGVYDVTGQSATITYTVPQAEVAGAAGGSRKKRKRKLLEIDGKLVEFRSEREIISYLESIKKEKVKEAKEVASSVALRAVEGAETSPPRVSIAPIEINDSSALIQRVDEINAAIHAAYIRQLEIDAEIEDEEMLLLLL
jgi:hypothetical protein